MPDAVSPVTDHPAEGDMDDHALDEDEAAKEAALDKSGSDDNWKVMFRSIRVMSQNLMSIKGADTPNRHPSSDSWCEYICFHIVTTH
jgi:hypothetical protein